MLDYKSLEKKFSEELGKFTKNDLARWIAVDQEKVDGGHYSIDGLLLKNFHTKFNIHKYLVLSEKIVGLEYSFSYKPVENHVIYTDNIHYNFNSSFFSFDFLKYRGKQEILVDVDYNDYTIAA